MNCGCGGCGNTERAGVKMLAYGAGFRIAFQEDSFPSHYLSLPWGLRLEGQAMVPGYVEAMLDQCDMSTSAVGSFDHHPPSVRARRAPILAISHVALFSTWHPTP